MKLDRYAIFLPTRSRNVSTDLDSGGTGAREQIAAWLASELSDNGSEVHVFTNQEDGTHSYYPWDLHYVDHQMAAPMLMTYEWDAVISFDYPSVTQLEDLHKTCKRVIVAQNYFEIPPDAIVGPEFLDLVDTWVYPSEFSLKECSQSNGVDPSKGVVIPYAADERFFGQLSRGHKQDDLLRFIYANQAESGLAQMLRMWPRLNAEFPGSTLTVATPVDEFVKQIQWSHSIQSELALDIRDLIEQPGVRYIGRQGRAALAKEFANSDYLLYPAEPLMTAEIGSLPIVQAIASGCTPIFRDVDALKELYGDSGLCVPKDADFLDFAIPAIILRANDKELPDDRQPETIFEKWLEVLDADPPAERNTSYTC